MTNLRSVGLDPGGIHVCWIPQTGTPSELEDDRRLLDGADAVRISRLRSRTDREAATRRRAGVRRALAQAIDRPPEGLSISRTAAGAPFLREPRVPWLRFSVAQRGTWAVVVLGHGIDVGVDLERRVPLPYRQLAHRGLVDRDRLRVDAANDPATAFFEAWTALEASVKLAGARLADVLDAPEGLDATLGPRQILRPAAPAGFVVAVAVRRLPSHVGGAILLRAFEGTRAATVAPKAVALARR